LPKRRGFPKIPSERGQICIICDRKFYIDELFAEFQECLANIKDREKAIRFTIQSKEDQMNLMENKISKKKDELKSTFPQI
jgi:hypothetical protein